MGVVSGRVERVPPWEQPVDGKPYNMQLSHFVMGILYHHPNKVLSLPPLEGGYCRSYNNSLTEHSVVPCGVQ